MVFLTLKMIRPTANLTLYQRIIKKIIYDFKIIVDPSSDDAKLDRKKWTHFDHDSGKIRLRKI